MEKENCIMSSENNKRDQLQTSQQGSGSAENRGQERSAQQQSNISLNQQEDISNQLGSDKNRVADLDDLGMLSGRDDVSGGSGDRMENENTGRPTDR